MSCTIFFNLEILGMEIQVSKQHNTEEFTLIVSSQNKTLNKVKDK